MPTPSSFIVSAENHHQRLDAFLTAQGDSRLTRVAWQRVVKNGGASVNGKIVLKTGFKLSEGDVVEAAAPEVAAMTLTPEAMDLDVVFEDAHVLVLNKPAGLTVHPGHGQPNGTLVNGVLYYLQNKGEALPDALSDEAADVVRPGIVHRLDKDTSGLIVIAKTSHAHQSLAAQFAPATNRNAEEEWDDFGDEPTEAPAAKRAGRTYCALVHGTPIPAAGIIEAPMGRHKTRRTEMAVVKQIIEIDEHTGERYATGGKRAVTLYQTVQTFFGGALALVQCTLETGRTHQIRVHTAHKGFPIVGDPTYKKNGITLQGFVKGLTTLNENVSSPLAPAKIEALEEAFTPIQRQLLHAQELRFDHPETSEEMVFEAPLPADFANILAQLPK